LSVLLLVRQNKQQEEIQWLDLPRFVDS